MIKKESIHTIIHRDIKPDNILFTSNGIKICDLGSAKIFDDKNRSNPYVVNRYNIRLNI